MNNEGGVHCIGWAAMGPGQKLIKHEFDREPLKPRDCEVDVICCGVCRSDIHLLDGDWPFAAFPKPQISGHEIAGKIVKVGAEVKNFCVGDVVGIGWQKSSCQNCEWCTKKEENLCAENAGVCTMGSQGGFANKWCGDSRFCFKVPENLPLKYVGPLMCGGITVFSPIKRWAKSGYRVGVLGIGGLGHMAIKFAKAKGCAVTAFSRTNSKREPTLAMGADTYVNTSNPDETAKIEKTLDVLIITINVTVDWTPYVNAMRPNGVIVFVGAINDKPLSLPVFSLVGKNMAIAGSNIGGSENINEMLQFVADNPESRPMVETMPMKNINEAIERVKSSAVRFRMVVEN